jgi:Glycogen debranching enzyme
VHEVRRGKCATKWFDRYYGTADATPLFLILLSETWRWTDDAELVQELREPALAALRWIDEFGIGTATASSSTSGARSEGSTTSRGRTRAIRSASTTDGSPRCRSHRARCRATSTTQNGAWPSSPARSGAIPRSRSGSRTRPSGCAPRFDEAYWVDERGGYYALALDAEKNRVDSLCSNIGHLLWSGIVPPARVDAVVER